MINDEPTAIQLKSATYMEFILRVVIETINSDAAAVKLITFTAAVRISKDVNANVTLYLEYLVSAETEIFTLHRTTVSDLDTINLQEYLAIHIDIDETT